MIFFVQAGDDGPIKVVKSSNPEMWLKNNQSSHYDELRISQQIPDGFEGKAE